MSATQNKYKNNSNLYHSRQSGSTKASNKENSSIKNASIGVLLDVEDPNNKHRHKNKK